MHHVKTIFFFFWNIMKKKQTSNLPFISTDSEKDVKIKPT